LCRHGFETWRKYGSPSLDEMIEEESAHSGPLVISPLLDPSYQVLRTPTVPRSGPSLTKLCPTTCSPLAA
ncbi:MAG: hypothetical protein ACPIOQ_40400, partial [Promethearchaeia archaeon]